MKNNEEKLNRSECGERLSELVEMTEEEITLEESRDLMWIIGEELNKALDCLNGLTVVFADIRAKDLSKNMMILISSVLPIIAFFVQFGDLNASVNSRAPGPLTPNVVPASNPRDGLDDHRPPDERILHGDTYISLWLDPRNRRTVVRADFATNIVPTPQFVASNKFYMKLTNIGDHRGNFTVVGYFWDDDVLFGVRAPNPYAYSRFFLEPSASQWFIIYSGRAFKVQTNPHTGMVESVSLFPENVHERPENQRDLKRLYYGMGGVNFWIFYIPRRGYLGAQYCPVHPLPGFPHSQWM
ncbi:uncharacterized protein LOC117170802 [Belonocnema kinseyi]|uniref:uncharacterized protein LOC117170802 n=1 Tax=Belonocnema kinseyi TaxID=2817044 RepID=UPI00143D91D5|nr:uncharacterized protein LOC117170802 [Belonocnema kinseyi]